MKPEHKKILSLIKSYLESNPNQRFGQALLNLNINQFENINSQKDCRELRDIHDDNDGKIIERIESRLLWFELQQKVNIGLSKNGDFAGMTVNERLYVTGLMKLFDKYRVENKEYAKFILQSLKIGDENIAQILQ